MGIKRWLLVISIFVVVLGLLAVIFLETGADTKIVDSLIPKVEQKLGVKIIYEDVSISLTSVSFKNLKILPKNGVNPLMIIGRITINMRVGPMMIGNLDITAVRLDDLELRLGKKISGATTHQWQKVINKLKTVSQTRISTSKNSKKPEVHIVSGSIIADDHRFFLKIENFSGRITNGKQAIITVNNYQLKHFGQGMVQGLSGQLKMGLKGGRTIINLDSPSFEIPANTYDMAALVLDIKTSLTALGIKSFAQEHRKKGNIGANNKNNPSQTSFASAYKITIENSNSILVQSPKNTLNLLNVTGEISTDTNGAFSMNLTGGLSNTDAKWLIGGHWMSNENPKFNVEIPDIPLHKTGAMFLQNDHFNWSKSSADGQFSIEFDKKNQKLSFEGQTSVSELSFNHARVSKIPLSNLDIHLDFKGTYDQKENSINLERLLLSKGLARVTLRGQIHLSNNAFDLTANVPLTACRQVLEEIPTALKEHLSGVALEGRFGLDLHLAINKDKPDNVVLEGALENNCKILNWGDLPSPDDFKRPFSYTAYTKDGDLLDLISGPGTNRWTPYSDISPYLIEAVLTTEDGKFRRHSGMTLPEIKRSIELNLKKGGMLHGASTITMQLAKNLFLSRERTLARKLQELFFTWYLETFFTKNEILELYFNIIEYGPSLYGITDASRHYFGREPNALNLIESVFIIKLLPNPIKRYKSYRQNKVTDRKMHSLHKVLKTMLARNRITQAEHDEALTQELIFYYEGDQLPEYRMPVQRNKNEQPLNNNNNHQYSDDNASKFSEPHWVEAPPKQ